MTDHYHQPNKDQTKAASELKAEIEKNRERIANAQQLMLDKELPAADYREIKEFNMIRDRVDLFGRVR